MTELHGWGQGGRVSEELAEHRPETPVETRGATAGPDKDPRSVSLPLPCRLRPGLGEAPGQNRRSHQPGRPRFPHRAQRGADFTSR